MTSCCPMTALPISLRIASANPRISRTSIGHLPLPSENVACERRELRARAAPRRAKLVRPAPHRAAIDLRIARPPGASQPFDQRRLGQAGGRVQLPRHVLDDLVHVALDDD